MTTMHTGLADGPVEAVIISGPRKGEIVRLNGADVILTPEEEQAFDEIQSQLERTVALAKAAVGDLKAAREAYRRAV